MRSVPRRQAHSPVINAPGFHGKVPSRGDFVSRRLPPGFAPPWDEWLQRLMRASRARLGSDWLAAWQEAPVWHFTLGAGVAGPARCFGVLIPSVDRVGRHFPFTILGLARPGGAALPRWTLHAEALALSALDDAFDPDRLQDELAALGPPGDIGSDPLGDVEDWPPAVQTVIAGLLPGETLWWCRCTTRMSATLLRHPGLPDEDTAARFVAGPLTSSRPG